MKYLWPYEHFGDAGLHDKVLALMDLAYQLHATLPTEVLQHLKIRLTPGRPTLPRSKWAKDEQMVQAVLITALANTIVLFNAEETSWERELGKLAIPDNLRRELESVIRESEETLTRVSIDASIEQPLEL